MGGVAIKKIIGIEGRRISLAEKTIFQIKINDMFTKHKVTFRFIPEIKSKETFGDIDVLVDKNVKNYLEAMIKDYFKEEFQGVTTNKDIWSFAIDDVQIDFIFTEKQYMEIARYYFSNNDMGNLIGRVARGVGLKFGHFGLLLPVRDYQNLYMLEEITLSTDFIEILRFLKFNVDSYRQYFLSGFDTFEHMYEFVMSSELFNGTKYDLDKLNQANRIRNAKRTTYMNFINYLDDNPKYKNKIPLHPTLESYWSLKAVHCFGCEKEYFKVQLKREIECFLSEKLNGSLISNLTELVGKRLGDFIKDLKSVINDQYDSLEDITISKIEQIILDFYKKSMYNSKHEE